MARRGFVALGLLIICVIVMLFFKRSLKEGFAAPITTVSTIAGSTASGYLDGTRLTSLFYNPQGVAVDSSGNLYVADTSNHRIRKIDISGNVTTFAGSGTASFADGNGTSASLNQPIGITIDSSGNLYIAEYGNSKIRKITPDRTVTTIAGSTVGFLDGQATAAKFYMPVGITVDSSGNLYVADNISNRIRKIDTSGNVTTFAGSTQGSLDGQGTTAKFYLPSGIVVDSSGNLYIVDRGNHRIRKITPDGNVTTIAGSTVGSVDGQGTTAKFNNPTGITIDSSGNLYVSDYSSHRIRKITPGGLVTTIAGSTSGFADGNITTAKLNLPRGITVDSSGNLYVADTGNHKIRKIGLACGPGSQLSNGDCVSCAPGTYGIDGLSCTPCAAGKTSVAGSTLASACTSCAAGTSSAAGSTCSPCAAGTYSGVGSASCTPCAAGKTSVAGASTCTTCAAGRFSAAGASSCSICAAGTTSIAGASSCQPIVCQAGQYLNGSTCTTCAAGTYSGAGASSCTSCGTGLTSPAGSTSQAACACPAGQRSVTLNGVTKCVTNCPTMTKPPRTQGSDQALLFALANCAAKTFNYNNNGVMQTTNPCVNSFYDFDLQKCVNALGTNVGLGSSTPCSSSTVYSSATNACVPVRVIVKPGDPQLINTTGSPSQGDFRDCKTVDQGDCTILFKDHLGNSLTANPCAGNNQLYNFATKTCIAKTKKCCNYTDPLKAAADKSCAADTNLVITKNTALCPATSRTLCCNNAYATNTTCIKNNFWRKNYAFTTANRTKCASGFQDYQGVHLLNKKMAKMNRLV